MIKKFIDRRVSGHTYTVEVSADLPVVEGSVGAFGWNLVVGKVGGIKIHLHNGKPVRVSRYGETLWDRYHKWGRDLWADRSAQQAWWDHAFGLTARLS